MHHAMSYSMSYTMRRRQVERAAIRTGYPHVSYPHVIYQVIYQAIRMVAIRRLNWGEMSLKGLNCPA
jgi:hypothetical protein